LGHKLLILANYGLPQQTTKQHKNMLVVKSLWGVPWWGEEPGFKLKEMFNAMANFEKVFGKLDVLIVQYHSSLYSEDLNYLLNNFNGKKIITKHDSSFNTQHNFKDVDGIITHSKTVPGTHYIPFPVVSIVPKVFSFGMRRNDYTFLEKVCKELGINFSYHDPLISSWLPLEDLLTKIRLADLIILWYNDVKNLSGQSSALRTAISCYKPVIVNDIKWFADAPNFVRKVKTEKELKEAIIEELHLDFIKQNSFLACAKKYLEVINGIQNL